MIDHNKPSDTILKRELLELASQERLRMRAFGETVIFGHHRPFDGDSERATGALSDLLDHGLVTVYRDEDGLFVGPSNPALIEAEDVGHGV
jgi:hypothetical protein